MKITVTHRLDDTYIEKAWKHAEMEEIEDLAAELLGKAQEAQSIEDDSLTTFCRYEGLQADETTGSSSPPRYAASWTAEWIDSVTGARIEGFGTEIRRGGFSAAHAPN